jgi:cellobiose epimerase
MTRRQLCVVAVTAVLFPAMPSPYASSASDAVKAFAPALRRNLEQAIVGFWYPRAIDREHGGYLLAFDRDGRSTGTPHKMIVSQARMVWMFARLARSGYRPAEMREAAAQGYRFLADRMWDPAHGGFYWEVDAAGATVTDAGKYFYGQAFGLYALSEYFRATGDRAALELASRTFDVIVQHGRDPEFGGYYEFQQRDWSPPPAGQPSYIGGPAGAKLMNTHLHLLEAFAEYYRASQLPAARERLFELITIESNSVVRKDLTACTDQYRRDWTPILDGDASARVSYGHDLENIWLLADAVETVGQSNAPMLDLYRRIFAYSDQHGADRANGGFFYSGPFHHDADRLQKVWWVQAEALVSALTMYSLTREDRYAEAFTRVWQWIDHHQTDWTNGEWFQEVMPDGSPRGVKADAWKEGYHNARAMIQCLELLSKL